MFTVYVPNCSWQLKSAFENTHAHTQTSVSVTHGEKHSNQGDISIERIHFSFFNLRMLAASDSSSSSTVACSSCKCSLHARRLGEHILQSAVRSRSREVISIQSYAWCCSRLDFSLFFVFSSNFFSFFRWHIVCGPKSFPGIFVKSTISSVYLRARFDYILCGDTLDNNVHCEN